MNAASYAGSAIAPQEFVFIFGSNFAAPSLEQAAIENNFYPFGIGRTQVLFNGIPAPITALAAGQIKAIVPSAVTNGTAASVQVEVDDTISLPITLPVAVATPSLWTANLGGSREAAVINADASVLREKCPVEIPRGRSDKAPSQHRGLWPSGMLVPAHVHRP